MKQVSFICDLCDRTIDSDTAGTGIMRTYDGGTLTRAALDYQSSVKHLCNNCIEQIAKMNAAVNLTHEPIVAQAPGAPERS